MSQENVEIVRRSYGEWGRGNFREGTELFVATWNIREFGGLTDKWRSTATDSPKRDLHSLACIARREWERKSRPIMVKTFEC